MTERGNGLRAVRHLLSAVFPGASDSVQRRGQQEQQEKYQAERDLADLQNQTALVDRPWGVRIIAPACGIGVNWLLPVEPLRLRRAFLAEEDGQQD
jgi:hypothetical protein